MSNPIVDAFYCNLVRYDPDAEMNRCVECGQIVESPTDHDGGCPVAAVHALVWGPAVPTVESLVAENARLRVAMTDVLAHARQEYTEGEPGYQFAIIAERALKGDD